MNEFYSEKLKLFISMEREKSLLAGEFMLDEAAAERVRERYRQLSKAEHGKENRTPEARGKRQIYAMQKDGVGGMGFKVVQKAVLVIALAVNSAAYADDPAKTPQQNRLTILEKQAAEMKPSLKMGTPSPAMEMPDTQTIDERVEEFKNNIKLPEAKTPEQVKAIDQANDVGKFIHSDSFTEKLKHDREGIMADVFHKSPLTEEQMIQKQYPGLYDNRNARLLKGDEAVYIFISSSMPLTTLRNLAASIDKSGESNIRFIMRGFLPSKDAENGKIDLALTANFVRSIFQRDSSCQPTGPKQCEVFKVMLYTEPRMFDFYRITEVPAIVYTKKAFPGISINEMAAYAEPEAESEYYILRGDLALWDAIRQINMAANSPTLEKLLERSF